MAAMTNYETRIQKRDMLSIQVSSLNPELDTRFNGAAPDLPASTANNKQQVGYVVDENGKIRLHFLGDVPVEGMTRNELKNKLERDLQAYLKEPIIGVHFLNRKVTVMGNVSRPQVIYMNEEKITLFDALATGGELKEKSRVENIVLVRDSMDFKLIRHLSLKDHSVFNSPFYYLEPNDVLYVLADKEEEGLDVKRRTTQTTISLIASVVSLAVILINALTR